MKTERTKHLEKLLEEKFDKRNDFYVFECTLGWHGSEIVDCIMYNCQRVIYCYEIKQSVQDFHSKNKLSFFGNKNYFVMPASLYEKVKDEIPEKIGVFIAIDHLETKEKIETNEFGLQVRSKWTEAVDGMKELYCIKPAITQELKADKEVILSAMLRSMQRDKFSGKFAQENYELKEIIDKANMCIERNKREFNKLDDETLNMLLKILNY